MNARKLVTPVAVITAILFSLLSVFLLSRLNSSVGDPLFYVPFGLSIILIPIGFLRRLRTVRILDARRRVSDFLRDLSEYTMYGTPISEAVKLVSANDYGYLNNDVRELVSSISIGIPVEEALRNFGASLKDPHIERFGIILQKSGESGSNTSDVISLVSRFSTQMQLLYEERSVEMKNYNLILMVSFAVFLLVMVIIDLRFFDSIKVQPASGFLFQSAGAALLKKIFDIGIYIEAFGIGLMIGLIRDRNLVSGFMETGAMLLISSLILFLAGAL